MAVSSFRTLFLAPQKARAVRIAELIAEQETVVCGSVSFEFIPAVGVFGSCEDEGGNQVRYLSSIDYFGPEAKDETAGSLLPFFDEEGEDTGLGEAPVFTGISAVAVGPGYDGEDDLSKIRGFFKTMSTKDIPVNMIKPNPEFATMKEELNAFRQLSPDEKEEVLRLQTMGPGKMAKFVIDMAVGLVEARLHELQATETNQAANDDENQRQGAVVDDATDTTAKPPSENSIDPQKMRYCCRKCRTILFGEDQLEDPPHTQAKHHFSARKVNHGGAVQKGTAVPPCQSLFLQAGSCSWMGDMSEDVGKLVCPKCETKLGTWHWSGAQCSCGTWVVPAIQIPRSKVDEVAPFQPGLPAGTVVSAFARLQAAQIRPG